MSSTSARRLSLFLALCAAPCTLKAAPQTDAAWRQPLVGAPAALHVLNRLAFGPTPGQVEDVQKTGVRAWIETQLHPATIDDAAVDATLAGMTLIQSSPNKLSLMYRGDNGAIRRFLQKQMAGADANAKVPRADRPLNARQMQAAQEFQAAGFQPGVSVQTAGELVQAKLVRAVESKRQLQEVLADFWSNHFNVDMRKNVDRTLKVLDDREVIRPHLFGSFRELLGASAHSPAMLVYLDNARSTKETKNKQGQTRGGLNENYARELMELHTVGVDGGYTQTDVTEVARCFTGWGVDRDGATFEFHPRFHDDGEKHVLGRTLRAGGEQDGEDVLDMLAASPQTAHFLSQKLCQRFVADQPPVALVDKVAGVWMQSRGDLPTVYRALFLSPEFLSQGAYRAKIKSPFEYTVSAVRALGGQLSVPDEDSPRLRLIGALSGTQANGGGRGGARAPLAAHIATLGQPVFACLPPTGWSEDSSGWVSAGAIVGRLNFALALTNGGVGDVRLSKDTYRAAPLDELSAELLGGQLSDATRATIAREIAANPGDGAKERALVLGSPEFQRR